MQETIDAMVTALRRIRSLDEKNVPKYAQQIASEALRDRAQCALEPIAETGTVHILKTWPRYFNDILSGRKPFEWRVDDRYFAVGDILVLQEWEPERENLGCKEGRYTGREIRKLVSYVFNPFPTKNRTAIMALSAVTSTECGDGK